MDLDPLEDPDLELDPDPELDSDPAWIRIHMIQIPALLDTILVPDSDPAKNGIVTPLEHSHLLIVGVLRHSLKRRRRRAVLIRKLCRWFHETS